VFSGTIVKFRRLLGGVPIKMWLPIVDALDSQMTLAVNESGKILGRNDRFLDATRPLPGGKQGRR